MRAILQASSQRWLYVDADAPCKRALTAAENAERKWSTISILLQRYLRANPTYTGISREVN